MLFLTEIKCDLITQIQNNSEEINEISKCITKITNQFFESSFIVYADNNEDNDIANTIIKQISLNFSVRFANGGNIDNNNIYPNYIILPENNDHLYDRLEQLKLMLDWNPQSMFIVVVRNMEQYHLKRTVEVLWQALISNFVILFYDNKNLLTLFRASFYNMISKCGTEPYIENIGSCNGYTDDLQELVFIQYEENQFLRNCSFDILTIKCEPIVFNASNEHDPGKKNKPIGNNSKGASICC